MVARKLGHPGLLARPPELGAVYPEGMQGLRHCPLPQMASLRAATIRAFSSSDQLRRRHAPSEPRPGNSRSPSRRKRQPKEAS
jgi:hypothetical protein